MEICAEQLPNFGTADHKTAIELMGSKGFGKSSRHAPAKVISAAGRERRIEREKRFT
jgi:hypothetical protein